MSIRLRELKLEVASLIKSESGLSGSGDSQRDLVVSLTSFPPRFKKLHITLESILSQTKKPSKICLWIAEDDMSLLPKSVTKLQNRGLEILRCPDIRSYKKIIFSLQKFEDAIIVTADDDTIYPSDWLSTLMDGHIEYPDSIVCHRARLMTFNQFGDTNAYRFWPLINGALRSELVFPIGVGGVLYPPNSLSETVFDQDLFLKLCPHGDDIWLKMMSLINDRECVKLSHYRKHFKTVKGSQEKSLKLANMDTRNDSQISSAFSSLKIKDILLGWEKQRAD